MFTAVAPTGSGGPRFRRLCGRWSVFVNMHYLVPPLSLQAVWLCGRGGGALGHQGSILRHLVPFHLACGLH